MNTTITRAEAGDTVRVFDPNALGLASVLPEDNRATVVGRYVADDPTEDGVLIERETLSGPHEVALYRVPDSEYEVVKDG